MCFQTGTEEIGFLPLETRVRQEIETFVAPSLRWLETPALEFLGAQPGNRQRKQGVWEPKESGVVENTDLAIVRACL